MHSEWTSSSTSRRSDAAKTYVSRHRHTTESEQRSTVMAQFSRRRILGGLVAATAGLSTSEGGERVQAEGAKALPPANANRSPRRGSFLARLDRTPPGQRFALVRTWLKQHRLEFFEELRASRPVLVVDNVVLVSRYADVCE